MCLIFYILRDPSDMSGLKLVLPVKNQPQSKPKEPKYELQVVCYDGIGYGLWYESLIVYNI